VTVVVGYAAGGNTDVMARMASKTLSEDLKQSFVVDNRIGAGGAIVATYVAQSAPDGYTLFFAASPQIAIVPQVQKVTYDPRKDFAPVSIFGTGPFILGISSSIPAKTLAEFVSYAKTRKINYGSSGAVRRPSRGCAVGRPRGSGRRARPVPQQRAGDGGFAGWADRHVFRQCIGPCSPGRERQGEDPRCRYAATDEATSERPDDQRDLSAHVAHELERVPRPCQDAARDHR
jgi:Tripartite tricarboxylate transporter family receptor